MSRKKNKSPKKAKKEHDPEGMMETANPVLSGRKPDPMTGNVTKDAEAQTPMPAPIPGTTAGAHDPSGAGVPAVTPEDLAAHSPKGSDQTTSDNADSKPSATDTRAPTGGNQTTKTDAARTEGTGDHKFHDVQLPAWPATWPSTRRGTGSFSQRASQMGAKFFKGA